MSFERAWILNFLFALPLAALLQALAWRSRRQTLEAFAAHELLVRLGPLESTARAWLRNALVLAGLAMLITALAGPRWGERIEEISSRGVDIMVCVDLSRSMLVADIRPSRMERAKREIADLLSAAQGDRIGLVLFAGRAFVQSPLTLDYQAIAMYLKHLEPGLVPVMGTDLGDAIDRAVEAFDATSPAERVIVLLTDGEDNEGRGLEAARRAAKKGVRIFVLGVGDPAGGPIPAARGAGFEKDEAGNNILSRLNERDLIRIANEGGGDYLRIQGGGFNLERLYF
ncbi:MAG: VWA domain-containing protein, partial [Desulfatibacillaceae bacterium]|nr:VWA domain-containing protein [Desulfatibacillaceae bacterium]